MAADWHGTRVEQEVHADGVLQGFGVRHMRTRAIEYSASPVMTTGPIGYMVVGEPSDETCVNDDDEWDWDTCYFEHWGDSVVAGLRGAGAPHRGGEDAAPALGRPRGGDGGRPLIRPSPRWWAVADSRRQSADGHRPFDRRPGGGRGWHGA